MMASYAMGSFTAAASNTEATKVGAANREVQAYKVSYTVTDGISVHYAEETFETVGSATDEEVESYGASYTSGGMTISANTYATAGAGNTAGAKSDRWALGLSFAF